MSARECACHHHHHHHRHHHHCHHQLRDRPLPHAAAQTDKCLDSLQLATAHPLVRACVRACVRRRQANTRSPATTHYSLVSTPLCGVALSWSCCPQSSLSQRRFTVEICERRFTHRYYPPENRGSSSSSSSSGSSSNNLLVNSPAPPRPPRSPLTHTLCPRSLSAV